MTCAACSSHTYVRPVYVNVSSQCLAPGPSALVDYAPSGDFPRDPVNPVVTLSVASRDPIPLPPDTRSVLVDVHDIGHWIGTAEVPGVGDVNVLAWPLKVACKLSPSIPAEPGEAMGLIDPQRVLIVPVTLPPLVLDLSTGIASRLTTPLARPRRFATVTPFAGGALIAGGVSADTSEALPLAEVFELGAASGAGSLPAGEVIALNRGRAGAGAAVLATGETLLAGGTDGVSLLSKMETVGSDSLRTHVSSDTGATLAAPRNRPVVVRLPGGKILVAGGVDAAGKPVSLMEWFAADLSSATGTASLPAAGGYLFAPVEGDSVLVVATSDAPPTPFANVFVARPCSPTCAASPAPPLVPAPGSGATLFPGAGGRPLLWNGSRWLAWSPWQNAFDDEGNGAATGADAGAPTGDATGPLPGLPSLSPDPGLALWITNAGFARGFRQAARGPYSTDDTVSSDDTAPDRLSGADVGWSQGLSLANGAGAFLSDATFAKVSVDMTMGPGCRLVLRDEVGAEIEVGGDGCPLPSSAGASPLHVERAGAAVTFAIAGGPVESCASLVRSDARLSVGWRGPPSGRATCLVSGPSVSRRR